MQDPSSYTFKLTNRAATNLYTPYSDGPYESGWRVLKDSHNTVATNASLQISWEGTAITVNGFVNSSQGAPAYMLSLDGGQLAQETLDDGRLNSEILLSKNGLPPGNHSMLITNIEGGNLTVKGIQLSISTGANRTTWRDRSVSATVSSNGLYSPNPFFTFGGDWFPAKSISSPPMLTTSSNTSSSVLSFTLSKCSSFFLYGPMTYKSGAAYNVQLNPPVRNQDSAGRTLNSTLGPATNDPFPSTQDEILFWESGLNRNMNYTVNVNILPGGGQWGVSKLVMFDATDLALSNSSGSGKISTGLIVALVIGFLVLCCIGGGASSKKVRTQVTEVWVVKRVS